MSEKNILYREDNFVAIITLNRPKVYNALGKEDKFLLRNLIKKANKSSNVRSLIIAAEGKAFCTGQDLGDRNVQQNVDLGHTLETEWNPLVTDIRESQKIVIAAVNGVCAGAGLSLGLSCDLIAAHPKAKFISSFSKLGLAPDAGCSALFIHSLGHKKTMEFFLFSEPLTAIDLLKAGLINQLDDNPLKKAVSWADKLSTLPLKTMAAIKKNLQRAADVDYTESLKGETYTQRYLGNAPEYQEGLRAFMEKRVPVFYPNI